MLGRDLDVRGPRIANAPGESSSVGQWRFGRRKRRRAEIFQHPVVPFVCYQVNSRSPVPVPGETTNKRRYRGSTDEETQPSCRDTMEPMRGL